MCWRFRLVSPARLPDRFLLISLAADFQFLSTGTTGRSGVRPGPSVRESLSYYRTLSSQYSYRIDATLRPISIHPSEQSHNKGII